MSISVLHSIILSVLIYSRGLPKGQWLTADLQIAVAELLPLCCSSSFDLSGCSRLYPESPPRLCILAGTRGSDLRPRNALVHGAYDWMHRRTLYDCLYPDKNDCEGYKEPQCLQEITRAAL